MLFRYMTFKSTRRYIDKVDDLTHAYNHRYHRSIWMRPVDVNADNQQELFYRMYGDPREYHVSRSAPKYRIGDLVRMSRIKEVFEKGFDESYSREIYKISQILHTHPIEYKVKSLKHEPIYGRFYEKELIPI